MRKTYKYSKKRVNRTKKPKVVSKAVKKYVKSTIARRIEDKYHLSYATNNPIIGQYILPLTAAINQGTGNSQRTANQISVKSAYINFAITLNGYNATTNPYPAPVHFRWFLVSQRTTNSATFNATNFFEVNNSSIGIQNNYLDQLLRVNPEHYNVHRQGFFRLGITAGSNTFPVSSTTIHDNSKYSITKKLYFNKYMNKKWRYDDASTSILNTNCWFVLIPTCANGISNTTYQIAYINHAIHTSYEDA